MWFCKEFNKGKIWRRVVKFCILGILSYDFILVVFVSNELLYD